PGADDRPDPPVARQHMKARAWSRLPIHLALLLGCGVMLFPFFWMVSTSFKNIFDATANPPIWLPATWGWENYREVLRLAPFGRYFLNTVFIALVVTFLDLATGAMAAYAFVRMQFKGSTLLFLLFLATLMVPFEVLIVPDFIIIQRLGWYNTYQAMIVPFAA